MYCETIQGWFFASPKALNLTAPSNGGKPVGLTLTYSKAISDITNNDVVLKICGKIAERLAVPYSRVTDAYGGFFGNPSPSLPKSAPAKPTAAATNTTANKTRMLNATATNATAAPKQTEWKLNLFVQPDPFAATVDNAATATLLGDATTLAAVNTVTSATYGSATAKAAVVTEAAVSWVKKPAATGGAKQITIGGSTKAAAYVYCAVAKTPSRLRVLNTTNTTNTTAAPAAAPVAKEPVNLQSASMAAKYTIQRQETTATATAFSLVFSGLAEGKTYSWMCEATSLSPTNPSFRTAMEKGSAATFPPTTKSDSDSALWSSLFAAVLMIAAVFFY